MANLKLTAALFAAVSMFTVTAAGAQTIAACGSQSGRAYYPAAGLVPKGKDGWTDDQISGGATTLTLNANGEFDILFKDSSGEVLSARNDGGEVILLRRSKIEITVLVAYPSGAQAAEIYAFVREVDGKAKMLQLSSKGLSATIAVPKAGVYVADCTTLALPLSTWVIATATTAWRQKRTLAAGLKADLLEGPLVGTSRPTGSDRQRTSAIGAVWPRWLHPTSRPSTCSRRP